MGLIGYVEIHIVWSNGKFKVLHISQADVSKFLVKKRFSVKSTLTACPVVSYKPPLQPHHTQGTVPCIYQLLS